jgi:hypothetical protein
MTRNGIMYSLKQAAEAAGRGKPAILRAIQRGIISGQRNAKNEWMIDPSELHRVYPLVARNDSVGNETERDAILNESPMLRQENDFLKKQLEREREISQELSRRLDEEASERRKLTAILTYKPEKKTGTLAKLFRRKA